MRPSVHGPGLCDCGCGETTRLAPRTDRAKGWTKGQPLRYMAGHGARVEPHFGPYEVDPLSGCWNWMRHLDRYGYGRRWFQGKSGVLAHRVAYEIANGPVPAGLELDHLCRNRRCVNPDHLEPVTRAENLHRGIGTKLDPARVEAIRTARADEVASVARGFGISPGYAFNLRCANSNSWRAEAGVA